MDSLEKYKNKKGLYYCPVDCHDPSYPKPSWKTEKGIGKHLQNCLGSYAARVARYKEEARQKEDKRLQELQKQREEIEQSPCPRNVGDIIYYHYRLLTHPIYQNGRKVHYQEIHKSVAAKGIIDKISVELINNQFYQRVYFVDGRQITKNNILDCDSDTTMEVLNKEYLRKHKEYIEMLYKSGD